MNLKRALPAAWYAQAPWLRLLQPLAWLYGKLAARRRRRLERGAYRAKAPVIVCGNISVGGAGKTPLTLALAQELQARGLRVVILSRGYGGKSVAYPLLVNAATPVAQSGDEALLLALRAGCPVLVDPSRARAARHAETELQADVLVCDDGLQHYALARDIEIAVVDGARGLGNGRLLPAGPLREPPARLDTVTCVVINGEARAPLPNFKTPRFNMHLKPQGLHALQNGRALSVAEWQREFGQGPVHAVAGIGNPERFFHSLRELGFVIIAHAYADHQRWQRAELDFADALPVLMTEKDAVKYRAFADGRHWALRVDAELPARFFEQIHADLIQKLF
ncbi:MAG: tetraacyldisaccharide 4'-kinase [Pseudomonadales bacterium]|jgi:tetraacyldisaccharide 4'-kinase|nr:tetraacyldisaccharide 4'-kinase [Pseudomonadales bacterium]